jgi:alkylresorcinol/alkylpyrone synthase
MAARLLSLATARPAHVITRDVTREGIRRALTPHAAGRYLGMVDSTGVDTRASVLPVEELFRVTDLGARTEEYIRHALVLGEDVSRRALAAAGVAASDVDVFVTASCTGYMMPSLEARLAPRLGTRADVRRVPLTELGCSAGAASLGLAGDLLAGGRARTALVASVELCSLCLQVSDLKAMDVVGALLFGDGAAAAVVRLDDAVAGLELVGSRSVLWADSLDELGMRLTATGLRLGLSTSLVRLIRDRVRPTVDAFLAATASRWATSASSPCIPAGRPSWNRWARPWSSPRARSGRRGTSGSAAATWRPRRSSSSSRRSPGRRRRRRAISGSPSRSAPASAAIWSCSAAAPRYSRSGITRAVPGSRDARTSWTIRPSRNSTVRCP